ncbi:helix-turn-helix domain-containing protein [Streptomyces geranii]|uniref:helix-turn-helix domain-containing protein n=1 Tax=Streptomyces geranii TaxID=2058923 RepID=UPI000D02F504|nr:helix-turn-helix domain-containing protein [Streptomyces geranii]
MGRPEKPVDRTVPARAKLAVFLRRRKADADLTYEQMAEKTNGLPSKATFERAASGVTVPSWDTVAAFVTVTTTAQVWLMSTSDPMVRAKKLWVCARRATRAPYYVHKAPDPRLISIPADLSRALRHQHIWAGCPSPGEMERMSGPGELPATTTRRIIAGDILPVDPKQAIAFLKACDVLTHADLKAWLAAAIRAFKHDSTQSRAGINEWVLAPYLLPQPDETRREEDKDLPYAA